LTLLRLSGRGEVEWKKAGPLSSGPAFFPCFGFGLGFGF
jgi:hypothetical protein